MSGLRIPLSSPDIDDDDIAAVCGVLRTAQLSLGPKLMEFEERISEYLGSPHAAAVSSGTAGLHLALLALGIGPGDEVIVPSFTFIAAANAIRYVGAVPIFVDIDAVTLNLDPDRVQQVVTPRTRAMIIVHTFGLPAEVDALMKIAAEHRLKVIEDACEAIGATYGGRKVGVIGDTGVFAFYPNKQITTGEGGIVVSQNEGVISTIRSLRNQGRRQGSDWLEHTDLGYNYRISEMACALGISQLRRIDDILQRRRAVAEEYDRQLRNAPELILPPLSRPDRYISWFVYVVRLTGGFTSAQRDAIRRRLMEQDIGCGRYFAPIHLQPAYAPVASAQVRLPVTEAVAGSTLALPFFNRISKNEIGEVCNRLTEAVRAVSD